MTGPTTHATVGGAAALTFSAMLEVLGPSAPFALAFGALGGATRWFGERLLVAQGKREASKWHVGLWAVPLGAAFALGMFSIAGPLIAIWAGAGTDDDWVRVVLSDPEARNGISYFLGLFASQIMSRIQGDISGGK